jgi:RHS repeat-associated protein
MYYTHSPSAIGGIISRDNNGTKLWYHFDRLGNVMAITDSNGNMYAGYTMEAFGNLLWVGTSTGYYLSQSDPQRYHLTTKEVDPDTILYYFSARWYDPATGRFVSRDAAGGPYGRYKYCNNRPTVQTDATGLRPQPGEAVLDVRAMFMSVTVYSNIIISASVTGGVGRSTSSCPCTPGKRTCKWVSLGGDIGFATPVNIYTMSMTCHVPGQKCLDADAIGGFFADATGNITAGLGIAGGAAISLNGGMICEILSWSFGLGCGGTVGISYTWVGSCSS